MGVVFWNDDVDLGSNGAVFLGRWVDVRVGWKGVAAVPKKEGGCELLLL